MKARRIAALAEAHAGALAGSLAVAVAVAALCWWIVVDPTSQLVERRPGMDGRTEAATRTEGVAIGKTFAAFDGIPGGPEGSWPGFRGAARDNIAADASPDEEWGPAGPPVLWSVTLGEGHGGPAVDGGRVFLLDYDEASREDALRAFSLADGREIWRRSYRVRLKRNHGFSRTVPAIAGGRVVTLGPRGHVMAVDASSGDLRWTIDLEKDYGTTIPLWYTGQCPLIDRGVVVLAPAAKALLIGVELESGRTLWSVANPHGWQMSHASVMRATIGGTSQYIYSALGGMLGVAADGPEPGRVLWQTTLWNQAVLAPSPLLLPGGRIFVTAGYGAGSAVLRIAASGGGYSVTEEARFPPTSGLASEQQTPVLFRGHVYGILPKDAGALRNQLACYRAEDLTRPVWVSGPSERFGLGPYLVAGDRLFVLDDAGVLTLVDAGGAGYRRIARTKVFDGVDAWAPMALVGGRLLLRDTRRLLCLDVGVRRVTGARG